MNVVLEGDGILKDIPQEDIIHTQKTITVTALDGGMESGKPSVAFIIELPDGKTVVAETSMALFQAAATAFQAKYGWPLE